MNYNKYTLYCLCSIIIFWFTVNLNAQEKKLEAIYQKGPESIPSDEFDAIFSYPDPSFVEPLTLVTAQIQTVAPRLKETVASQPENKMIRVIIHLDQDIQNIIRKDINTKYEKDMIDLKKQTKSILSSYSKLRDKKAYSDKENYSKSILQLSEDDKDYLFEIGAAKETLGLAIKDELKASMIGKTMQYQEEVIQEIISVGGVVEKQTTAGNCIIASIPADAVYYLSGNEKVIQITEDRQIQSHLDNADDATLVISSNPGGSFWDNDKTGGIFDPAILDSGTDLNHPALTDSPTRTNFYSWYLEAARTDDKYADQLDEDDRQGHGTHVMGIVASYGSSGWEDYLGMSYGIEKTVTLKAGYNKTSGTASMYWSDAMVLVDRALYHDEELYPLDSFNDDVDGINLSYGSLVDPGTAETSFCRFWDSVIMDDSTLAVTISAGNDGPLNTEFSDPGSAYNPITVANIDDRNTPDRSDDIIRSSSTRGPTEDDRKKPDISAPGTNIMSCRHDWEGLTNSHFISKTGTSMAAPAVLGILMNLKDAGLDDYLEAKALLINTSQKQLGNIDFEDDEDGWDEAFGWGYINAWAAYYHRDDTFKDSVTARFTDDSYNLYKGVMRDDPDEGRDKATLVWNRHATYRAATVPGNYHNLSDLNLRLYQEDDNFLIASDFDSNDNVHQVRVDEGAEPTDVVVKVYAWDISFPHGNASESYALATEEDFQKVELPNEFGASALWPSKMEPGETHNIEIWVTNSSDLACHNCQWDITLPEGWTIASGTNPALFGSIRSGQQSEHVTWSLTAPETTGTANIYYDLSHDSYGELWDRGYQTVTPITLEWDTTPPQPSDMSFAVAPYAIDENSIAMTAVTATDDRYNPCLYEFDLYNTPTGGSGGSDFGWTSSRSVTDSDLEPNNQYGYRVRARDGASTPNYTGYSPVKYAVTHIEASDGIIYGNITPNSIEVKSINTPTNLDMGNSGLIFYNISSGANSGWQQNNENWIDDNLLANTQYAYRAKTRNIIGSERDFSAISDIVYTEAYTPIEPHISQVNKTSFDFNINTADGNPAYTQYTVYLNHQYIDSNGSFTEFPVWQTASQWGTITIHSLEEGHSYELWLKAKNEAEVHTDWFGPIEIITAACGDENHPYPNGDLNKDCNVNIDDIDIFVQYWLNSCTGTDSYCMGADINQSGTVDMSDFSRLAENWLETTNPDN